MPIDRSIAWSASNRLLPQTGRMSCNTSLWGGQGALQQASAVQLWAQLSHRHREHGDRDVEATPAHVRRSCCDQAMIERTDMAALPSRPQRDSLRRSAIAPPATRSAVRGREPRRGSGQPITRSPRRRARAACRARRGRASLAALRLIAMSNLVDCTTGRSAGFSPLRIRPA